MIGIYFLLNRAVIIYVGKTKMFPQRIRAHSDKEFNAVRFIACSEEMLDTYERRWIQRFVKTVCNKLTFAPRPPANSKTGEYTIAQWAKKQGLQRSAIYMQIRRGNLKGAKLSEYLGRKIIIEA